MKFCLIGEKLSHSYSKEIHNLCGIDYSLKEIVRCGVGDFVCGSSFDGFNVTIPYKKEVIPFLDGVSNEVKEIGAVNTVANKNGKRIGYNTDVNGILYTLKRKGVSVKDKNVLVLGTGGASKAVEYVIKNQNGNCILVSRSGDINYENCYNVKAVKVIINATPVGTFPNVQDCPIDLEKFKGLEFVFDLVYNPQKTTLIKKAEELNIPCSNGLPMLVEQALSAEDIWLDKTHSKALTEEIISRLSNDKLNIALTGMPGCGKSTIGNILSKKLNKTFIDLDVEISNYAKKTPQEIINELGESEFRKIETEVLKKVLLNTGTVIALGGGAFISEENRELLSHSAVTVYVKRDLELLKTCGRPLSKTIGVKKLFEEREVFYNTADFSVDNNGDINLAVKEIIVKYENTRSKWT